MTKSAPIPAGPWVEVVGWDEFQHYKRRDPTWIKLYRTLLDKYEYQRLPDASKSHVVGIWMLAARYANKTPADPLWMAQRMGATEPVDLELLVAGGFIAIFAPPASKTLAQRSQVASKPLAECLPREEKRREEKRREKIIAPPAATSDPEPKRGGWPAELADVLSAIGTIAPGHLGKSLARTVEREGAPMIIAAARAYVKMVLALPPEKARFERPAKFPQVAGYWLDYVRPGGARASAGDVEDADEIREPEPSEGFLTA